MIAELDMRTKYSSYALSPTPQHTFGINPYIARRAPKDALKALRIPLKDFLDGDAPFDRKRKPTESAFSRETTLIFLPQFDVSTVSNHLAIRGFNRMDSQEVTADSVAPKEDEWNSWGLDRSNRNPPGSTTGSTTTLVTNAIISKSHSSVQPYMSSAGKHPFPSVENLFASRLLPDAAQKAGPSGLLRTIPPDPSSYCQSVIAFSQYELARYNIDIPMLRLHLGQFGLFPEILLTIFVFHSQSSNSDCPFNSRGVA
ncbi:hypothetical protein B0H19DRAFT_1072885 [Mycena capillaripes]|nr:hypothetical protein B0H19DRAFT_1072885 [Mycena capillaripes]